MLLKEVISTILVNYLNKIEKTTTAVEILIVYLPLSILYISNAYLC